MPPEGAGNGVYLIFIFKILCRSIKKYYICIPISKKARKWQQKAIEFRLSWSVPSIRTAVSRELPVTSLPRTKRTLLSV
jgi:hypothetical protein